MVCSCKDSVCCCSDYCSCSADVCSCIACLHSRERQNVPSSSGNQSILCSEKENILNDVVKTDKKVQEARPKTPNSPLVEIERCSQNSPQKNNSPPKKTFRNPFGESFEFQDVLLKSAQILNSIVGQNIIGSDNSFPESDADNENVTSVSALTTSVERKENIELAKFLRKRELRARKRRMSPALHGKDHSMAKRNKFQSPSKHTHLQRHTKDNTSTQVSGSESDKHLPRDFVDVTSISPENSSIKVYSPSTISSFKRDFQSVTSAEDDGFTDNCISYLSPKGKTEPQNKSFYSPQVSGSESDEHLPQYVIDVTRITPENSPIKDLSSSTISPFKNDFRSVTSADDGFTDNCISYLSPKDKTEPQNKSVCSPHKQFQVLGMPNIHASDQINLNKNPTTDISNNCEQKDPATSIVNERNELTPSPKNTFEDLWEKTINSFLSSLNNDSTEHSVNSPDSRKQNNVTEVTPKEYLALLSYLKDYQESEIQSVSSSSNFPSSSYQDYFIDINAPSCSKNYVEYRSSGFTSNSKTTETRKYSSLYRNGSPNSNISGTRRRHKDSSPDFSKPGCSKDPQ